MLEFRKLEISNLNKWSQKAYQSQRRKYMDCGHSEFIYSCSSLSHSRGLLSITLPFNHQHCFQMRKLQQIVREED